MHPGRILYIGGGREALETLQKAHELGLQIVYVQRVDRFRESLAPYIEQAVLTDYRDVDRLIPLARHLREVFGFSAVNSLSEDALIPVAHVREALGLPGNSLATVRRLKDKGAMRAHLRDVGFSVVAARLGASRDDIAAFGDEVGYPLIVKPADSSGSQGVLQVDSPSDLDRAWNDARRLGVAELLMEEYLDGPEYSVESFTFHGRHVILAVTDKTTLPNHVEVGHSLPAPLDDRRRREIAAFVIEFLTAVGLQEGPAHTELKLTSHGLRIIESHDRPGGDRINELVRVVYGVDMKSMALGWPCGLVPELHEPPAARGGAAIQFFMPEPGYVKDVRGVEDARASAGLVELVLSIRPGDLVRPVTESYDRCGHVIAAGNSAAEAVGRCREIIAKVDIETGDNGVACEAAS